MIVFGPRAIALALLGSHLLRSALFQAPSPIEQLDSDVQAFRQELARGQRLLSSTNSALEACYRESEIQRFLLKASGAAELVLVVVFIWFSGAKSRWVDLRIRLSVKKVRIHHQVSLYRILRSHLQNLKDFGWGL